MLSNAKRRIIMGPFRSGKSVCNIMEIMRRAKGQARGPDGLRHTRFAVIRNTMRQLVDTTIKTWLDWIPDGPAGRMRQVDKSFIVNYDDVRCEVMFRALDDAADLANLLSLELTAAYINEAREIHPEILEALDARVNQYPKKIDGGCTWAGIFADTNPPREGDYWHSICEDINPNTLEPGSGWEIFKQPSGLAADAENVEYLPDNYYQDLAVGKTAEYVRVYIKNQYGKTKGGKPVHSLYDPDIHDATTALIENPNLPLLLAHDFGRTPAVVFMQEDPLGRLLFLDEVTTVDMGLDRCLKERVKPLLRSRFAGYDVRITGDPSGWKPGQNDEQTCLSIFKKNGFHNCKPAPSNNPIARQGAMSDRLALRPDCGGILIDPRCLMFKRGMGGGYQFKVNKQGVALDEVEKNIYSHICEAGEYGVMYYKQPVESKQRDQQAMMVAQAQRRQMATAKTYAMRR